MLLWPSVTFTGNANFLQSCNLVLGDPTRPDIVYSRRSLQGWPGSMHFAWSMLANPTIFISQSKEQHSCNDSLNSTGNYPGSWSVAIPGLDGNFAAAIVFRRLIEFNVTDQHPRSVDAFNASEAYHSDDVDCANESYCSYWFSNKDLQWNYTNTSQTSQTFHFVEKEENSSVIPYEFLIKVSRISIQVCVCAKPPGLPFPHTLTLSQTSLATTTGLSRLPHFPKSILTVNNTAFDIVIKNFTYRLKDSNNRDKSFYYNTNRLAIELMIVHGPQVANGSVSRNKHFDDEYTPAVFTTYQYEFGMDSRAPSSHLGYLQWKPVSYTSSGRASTSSQQINMADTSNVLFNASLPMGLASALFGKLCTGKLCNVTLVYMVFGTSGDDSALSSTYLTW